MIPGKRDTGSQRGSRSSGSVSETVERWGMGYAAKPVQDAG